MDRGRDAIEPGLTGSENSDDHRHFPYPRPLHVGWRRDRQGCWVSETTDDTQWEVVCAQCGDSGGPIEDEQEGVRLLRGPYASKHKAKHAATEHAKQWSPSAMWIPGSAFPESF